MCLIVMSLIYSSRLSDKLKQNLDSQLQSVGASDLEPLKDDEQVLRNLEQQAQSALQVKLFFKRIKKAFDMKYSWH